MKWVRTILVIVGIFIAIGLLAQKPKEKGLTIKQIDQPIGSKGKLQNNFQKNFSLESNLEWNNDVIIVYSKPFCCRKWSWSFNLPIQGDDMIYRVGFRLKINQRPAF